MFLQKLGGVAPVLASWTFLSHGISGRHLVSLPLFPIPWQVLAPCPSENALGLLFTVVLFIHHFVISLCAYLTTGLGAIEDLNNNSNSSSNNIVLPMCLLLFEVLYKY